MKLWVYDPGQTTGWASFTSSNGTAVLEGSGVTTKWEGIDKQLRTDNTVVVESFYVLGPGVDAKNPLETIGVIRYLAKGKRCSLVEQPPSFKNWVRKRYPDLIAVGHAGDAILHGVYHLTILMGIPIKNIKGLEWK